MGAEDVLDVMVSGTIRVTANQKGLARVDANGKTIDMDISGIRVSGLSATRLLGHERKGVLAVYRETKGLAVCLADKGWRLNLKDADREVANLGRGVSGMMGPVHIHLFQIGRMMDAL